MRKNSTHRHHSQKKGSNRGWAILSAVFFFPLGLVSLIHSIQSENLFKSERPIAAQESAAASRMWTVISIIVGAVVYLFLGIYSHVTGKFLFF